MGRELMFWVGFVIIIVGIANFRGNIEVANLEYKEVAVIMDTQGKTSKEISREVKNILEDGKVKVENINIVGGKEDMVCEVVLRLKQDITEDKIITKEVGIVESKTRVEPLVVWE